MEPAHCSKDEPVWELSSMETSDYSDESIRQESTSCRTYDETVKELREQTDKFLGGNLSFQEYAASVEVKDEDTMEYSEQRIKKSDNKSDSIRKTRKNLPPVLKGMMGEANLSFVRGDHDKAMKICLEVIREHPTAPDPFQTLAQIYEEKNMIEKSLQFAMIAAHLNPRGTDQWIHLAELSLQQNEIQQALSCYTKAIKYAPNNINLHLVKAKLQEDRGDRKGAIKSYHRMIEVLTPELGEEILKYAKITARFYHEQGEISKAKEVMELAFTKASHLVTLEDVNLFVELLISEKDYYKALEMFTKYCDVKVEAEEDFVSAEENEEVIYSFRVLSCEIPENLPLDLRVQLTVLLIHTQAFHLIPQLLQLFENEDVELSGDLFIDIVEALMSQHRHGDALKLLKQLIESKNFSLAAVWLNYAECLKMCGKREDAISAYLMVMQQAPKHIEARIKVSELLNEFGRSDEALSVLTQDPKSEIMDAGLLYERCLLLKDNPERTDEFLAVGRLLMSRHCIRIKNRVELQPLTKLKVFNHKRDAVKKLQEHSFEDNKPDFIEGRCVPQNDEEWDLFKELCNTAFRTSQFPLLQRLLFSALGSTKFNSEEKKNSSDIFFMAILSCFFNKDSYHGYNLVRDLVLMNLDKPVTWNILNLIISNSDDLRHNKFIMRQYAQKPNHSALSILHANNCLLAGSYKYALSEYMAAFRYTPTSMLALLISITLLHLSGVKSAEKRNALIVQSVAFLCQYKEYRSKCMLQEVHYNTGRAFHQLGLLPAAVFHYKEALKVSSPLVDEHFELLDLKKEVAFNLALIYKNSGSEDLAKYYIDKYVIV